MFIEMSVNCRNANQKIDSAAKNFVSAGDTSAQCGKYKLVLAFPFLEFEQPVELTSPNDGTNRVFVIAQKGPIHVFPGKYIYGDFVSGNVWALTHSGTQAVKNELLTTLSGGLSSFGEDSESNLYLLAYGTGKVYRVIPDR